MIRPLEERYIGLMSGTSLDGVDAVLMAFEQAGADTGPSSSRRQLQARPRVLAHAAVPFPPALREECMALNTAGPDELHRAALVGNAVSRLYADAVQQLLAETRAQSLSGLAAAEATGPVRAIGAHGQTVRHRPGAFDGTGYTLQLQNPALLAELCGIDVVADFRSRDVAAGGQGAPLVPAFHHAWFGRDDMGVAVLNLGGIANLSVLPALAGSQAPGGAGVAGQDESAAGVIGFDCGPGNALIDLWCQRHTGQPYDQDGAWAATGTVHGGLLALMLSEPYLALPPPKSTGRDLFHAQWLDEKLRLCTHAIAVADVQATLTAFTVAAAAQSVRRFASNCAELVVCGGGAFNRVVMDGLRGALPRTSVVDSAARGLPPQQVEAAAFAWLARCAVHRRAGNLPAATGARGPRVLGALYPG